MNYTTWWLDQYASVALKMYYLPYFIAGNIDNWKGIYKNICNPKFLN